MKKILSMLLALAMVFSLSVPAMAAEETTTIYFENTAGWDTVYAYAWSDAGAHLGTWPGTAMTLAEGETDIYAVEVPAEATTIIFNNGTVQTADQTIPTDGSNLFTLGAANEGGTFTGGTWSVYGAAEGGNTGNTSKDVTASYTPVIKVTGMSIKGDNVTYDADTNTYTVVATETPMLDLVFSGTNLNHIAYEDATYLLETTASGSEPALSRLGVFFNSWYTYDEATGTMFQNSPYSIGTDNTYRFSNDGGTTWEDGLRLVVKQGYAVTFSDMILNGTVTADKAIAAEGDTVTLTVTPAEGYELSMLAVAYGEGEDVTDLAITNNTFTMPAGNVTVTATFQQATETYTVTVDENIANGTVVVNPTTYTAGQTVTLAVNPAEGYVLDQLTVTNTATGEEVTVTDNSFTMPAGNVTVTAAFKAITYTVNIGTITNGTVTTDPATAAEGEIVTVSVEAVVGYAYVVNSLKVINDTTNEEVEVNEEAKTFVMPASTVTVTAEFEKLSVTSAEISWGSLAFTYTDGENGAEGAWSADTTEGAGTVTVENTGTTTVTVSAVYTPKAAYAEITGTLGEEKTLAAGESGSFTLTLSGKPNKALSGETIGTVIVTIE